MSQVPVLTTPQGAIWESNAIARYVARLTDNQLYGDTPLDSVLLHNAPDLKLDNLYTL